MEWTNRVRSHFPFHCCRCFFFHEYTRVIRDHSCVTGDIKHFLTICHALIPAQVTPHA